VSVVAAAEKASGSAWPWLVRDVPPAGHFRSRELDRPPRGSIVENTAGGTPRRFAIILFVFVVLVVDLVDQGSDSQRIGRAALLLPAPLELRAGRGSWATAAPMMGFIMGCTCFKGTTLSHLFQGWYRSRDRVFSLSLSISVSGRTPAGKLTRARETACTLCVRVSVCVRHRSDRSIRRAWKRTRVCRQRRENAFPTRSNEGCRAFRFVDRTASRVFILSSSALSTRDVDGIFLHKLLLDKCAKYGIAIELEEIS